MHNPQGLQDYVLGKYYRHSRYSSFQRQLNYFGFKKKLHGGKKGKLCPCSYVHEGLGVEPSSLFTLKRRLRAAKNNNQAKNTLSTIIEGGGGKKRKLSAPEGGNDANKRAANVVSSSTATSVSSTSTSSLTGPFTKLGGGLSSPPSNKAVIVKDSNHANFLTTIPYPPPPMLTNDVPTATAPFTTLLPNFNLVQSTGNNNAMAMAMPFQPHLQAEIHKLQQQLLSNNAAAAATTCSNIQASSYPATTANKMVNNNLSSENFDTKITITRANEVAREAQKALERAYRKRKQEAADEDDIMAVATASAQQYQQQHHVQQQQMLLPGLHKLIQQQQQPTYTMTQNLMQNQQLIPPSSVDFTGGNDSQAVNNFPPMDTSGQLIDYASLGKQIWAQFNPQLIQGLNAQMGGFAQALPPAMAGAPTATLPPTNATASTMVPPFNQPRQNNGSSSPIMFDDLFSKLLSTALPPPEELFDDDSSAGQLSDFDAELQALG